MVQEQTGNKLANMCNSADPHLPDFCSRTDCFVCQTATAPTRGSCWKPGAVYKITCKLCAREGKLGVYHGESGHSAYFRSKRHLEALKNRTIDSVLDRHSREEHGDQHLAMKDFQMTVASHHRRSVSRLSEEGINIANSARLKDQGAPVVLMNNKSQFFQPGVARVNFSQGNTL